jgi:predicted RNA-binding Zn-ribbon protein involved in translation (DUF1610 family)
MTRASQALKAPKLIYYPQFTAVLGVTASILLTQINYWWDGKPFYKFRTPNNSKKYQEGDSWCEELGFSPKEFDTALKQIGTKIKPETGMSKPIEKKGETIRPALSKEQLFAVRDFPPFKEGEPVSEYRRRIQNTMQHMVVYWTDRSRVTWYQFNLPLFESFLGIILGANCRKGNLQIAESGITYIPETTTEKELPNGNCAEAHTPTQTDPSKQDIHPQPTPPAPRTPQPIPPRKATAIHTCTACGHNRARKAGNTYTCVECGQVTVVSRTSPRTSRGVDWTDGVTTPPTTPPDQADHHAVMMGLIDILGYDQADMSPADWKRMGAAAKTLRAKANPPTNGDLADFKAWDERTHTDLKYRASTPQTVVNYWPRFRADQRREKERKAGNAQEFVV